MGKEHINKGFISIVMSVFLLFQMLPGVPQCVSVAPPVLSVSGSSTTEAAYVTDTERTALGVYMDSLEYVNPVTVAVLDTGISMDALGEEYRARISDRASDFTGEGLEDANGHGTILTERILADTNGLVQLLPVKVAVYDGTADTETVIEGLLYAQENGADIINLSMNTVRTAASEKLEAIIQSICDSGIKVVISAGNDGVDVSGVTPAGVKEAVVVGAIGQKDEIAEYSNYGSAVDWYTYGNSASLSGTSAAAAAVSGMLADLYSAGVRDTDAVFEKYAEDADGIRILRKDKYDIGEAETEEAYNIGMKIMELDWEQLSVEEITNYFDKTEDAYVGMLFASLSEQDFEKLDAKVPMISSEMSIGTMQYNTETKRFEEAEKSCYPYYQYCIMQYEARKHTLEVSDFDRGVGYSNSITFYVSDTARTTRYKVTISTSRWFADQNEFTTSTITNSVINCSTVSSSNLSFARPNVSDYYTYEQALFAVEAEYYRTDNGALAEHYYSPYPNIAGRTNGTKIMGLAFRMTNLYAQNGYRFTGGMTMYKEGTNEPACTYQYYTDSAGYGEPYQVGAQTLSVNALEEYRVSYKVYGNSNWQEYYVYRPTGANTLMLNNGTVDLSGPVDALTGSTVYDGYTMWYSDGRLKDSSQWKTLFQSDVAEIVFDVERDPDSAHKLTVKPNGGTWSGSVSDQEFTLYAGDAMAVGNPTRSGYTFTGWTLSGAGSSMDGTTFKMGTADAVLTANWNVNSYTLTVKPNGGTWNGSASDQEFTLSYGRTKDISNPVRPGYTFAGWTLSGEGSSMDGTTFKMGIANAVLTANWNAIAYTIRFEGNGATGGNMSDLAAVYDQEIKLTANAFTKENEYGESLFKGWNLNPDAKSVLFQNEAAVKNLTDENGGVVTLYAIWDDCPGITSKDLYYTLEQAQSGYITEMELLNQAEAFDLEDGEISPGTHEDTNNSFRVMDYAESDFTQFMHSGSVTETYRVIDSAGNSYKEQITVYIVDTTADTIVTTSDMTENEGTTRFINEKYYNLPYEQGGLEDNSIWKQNPEYSAVIESAFENLRNDTPEQVFFFTHEEILQMKEFIQENGIGNTRSPDALQRFYEQFLVPNEVK